jgi:hypothetical protein
MVRAGLLGKPCQSSSSTARWNGYSYNIYSLANIKGPLLISRAKNLVLLRVHRKKKLLREWVWL